MQRLTFLSETISWTIFEWKATQRIQQNERHWNEHVSHTHTHTHTLSLSLSLSLTHTHTHTHTTGLKEVWGRVRHTLDPNGLKYFGRNSSLISSYHMNLQNESSHSEGSEKKRRKVVSQKGKLLADIFRGREERLQILKRMAEKNRRSRIS